MTSKSKYLTLTILLFILLLSTTPIAHNTTAIEEYTITEPTTGDLTIDISGIEIDNEGIHIYTGLGNGIHTNLSMGTLGIGGYYRIQATIYIDIDSNPGTGGIVFNYVIPSRRAETATISGAPGIDVVIESVSYIILDNTNGTVDSYTNVTVYYIYKNGTLAATMYENHTFTISDNVLTIPINWENISQKYTIITDGEPSHSWNIYVPTSYYKGVHPDSPFGIYSKLVISDTQIIENYTIQNMTITIDGEPDDWISSSLIIDPPENITPYKISGNLKSFGIASDNTSLYIVLNYWNTTLPTSDSISQDDYLWSHPYCYTRIIINASNSTYSLQFSYTYNNVYVSNLSNSTGRTYSSAYPEYQYKIGNNGKTLEMRLSLEGSPLSPLTSNTTLDNITIATQIGTYDFFNLTKDLAGVKFNGETVTGWLNPNYTMYYLILTGPHTLNLTDNMKLNITNTGVDLFLGGGFIEENPTTARELPRKDLYKGYYVVSIPKAIFDKIDWPATLTIQGKFYGGAAVYYYNENDNSFHRLNSSLYYLDNDTLTITITEEVARLGDPVFVIYPIPMVGGELTVNNGSNIHYVTYGLLVITASGVIIATRKIRS